MHGLFRYHPLHASTIIIISKYHHNHHRLSFRKRRHLQLVMMQPQNEDKDDIEATNKTILATIFDPKSPATLLIKTRNDDDDINDDDKSNDDGNVDTQKPLFETLLSDDGAGCNAEEIQCLIRIIDVHQKYHEQNSANSTLLCKAYRSQLMHCIQQLEERFLVGSKDEHDAIIITAEIKNNELLKMTHAIAHLAEIFLCDTRSTPVMSETAIRSLPLPSSNQLAASSNNYNINNNNSASFYNTSMPKKEFNQMGIVTADTIRYLRFHHLQDIDEYAHTFLFDSTSGNTDDNDDEEEGCTIMDMLESHQPEQWYPNNSDKGNMPPFWLLVRKLMHRGLLRDAWHVLSKHSACERATHKYLQQEQGGSMSGGGYIDQTIQEDIEAFSLIEKLLSFAPIPGGRVDKDDSATGSKSFGIEDSNDVMMEEEDDDDDDDENGEDDWWNGLTLDAYKLWNTTNNTSDVNGGGGMNDSPLDFNIHAIMNVYTSWKMMITSFLNSNPALKNLTRRIPYLQSCVWDTILNTEESFDGNDNNWAERLVAELLYAKPNIRRDDIASRALVHMQDCGLFTDKNDCGQQIFEGIVLEVMRGNAGTVIEALHSFGGASGAALPSTMTALLCSLLVDNGQIQLSDLSYDIQTEKLLSASTAILASFTVENLNDIGVRLSTKLLQSYIKPDNMLITAHVATILDRHWAKSDAEVRCLLEVCEDAVERGSFRMLDACESLCFGRSLFHRKKVDYEKSMFWLLQGVECAAKLGSIQREDHVIRTDVTRSMCYRHMTKLAVDMSSELLIFLSKDPDAKDYHLQLRETTKQARSVKTMLDDHAMSELAIADPSVALFSKVANIGWESVIEDNLNDVAKSIVECLEEQRNDDGSMIRLCSPKFYGLFLTIAFDILNAENEREGNGDMSIDETTESSVSFNVNGLQCLLCCFDCYCKQNIYGITSAYKVREDITLDKMRVALAKGLMTAFISQNAKVAKAKDEDITYNCDSSVNMDQLLGLSM